MSWTFDNKKPIYLQIMEKIKLQIVSHTLEPNQQLPTQIPSKEPCQTLNEKDLSTASAQLDDL